MLRRSAAATARRDAIDPATRRGRGGGGGGGGARASKPPRRGDTATSAPLLRGRTKGTLPDPFQNVHGAGYRGVYDFADPDSSVFIISTGQSGHPLSRHYDDMAQLWRRGEYIPMSLDEDLARAASVGVTLLTPPRSRR